MSSSKKGEHNVLPKELENHCFAEKYQYVNYDEELARSLGRGMFYVDSLSKPFHTLVELHERHPSYDPFQAMKEVTMEKGDYLLCCPPKTGQHWNWEIMTMLLAGKADYSSVDKSSTWFDVQPLTDIYSRCAGPRVLASHLMPSWLPKNFRRSDTKVVVTMRNLKDVFTSWYFHHQGLKSRSEEVVWPKLLEALMISKYNIFGSYFDQYADVWEHSLNDPNVMIVFYEDMKKKPEQTIEKLAQHMEVNYTPALISSIAEAVHISKMKPVKDAFGFHPTMNTSLYRKGDVGGWKDLFTVAQNEKFDRVWNEWNKERQIPFIYE